MVVLRLLFERETDQIIISSNVTFNKDYTPAAPLELVDSLAVGDTAPIGSPVNETVVGAFVRCGMHDRWKLSYLATTIYMWLEQDANPNRRYF